MSISNSISSKVVARLHELADRGDAVLQTHKPNPPNVIGFPTLDSGAFTGWRSQSLAYLSNVFGKDHVYTSSFEERTNQNGHSSEVKSGQAILRACAEDVDGGFLVDIKERISVDVFSDFLDMADHLLRQGLKDPAAMLAGAVLEDGLRRIAEKTSISVQRRDDISALNGKLGSKDAITKLIQKKISVWGGIRNSADHAHFDEYDADDVRSMIDGIGDMLDRHLG